MSGMVVQHNINAITSYNALKANISGLSKASEKLSTGYRINRAGDDAAGLAISEKMRSQIRGLNQAIRNSQDGISMIQTFEGAAQGAHDILQRMKELATESANGTYDDPTDRAAIQLEFDQLNDELNQIADTDFNGKIVLNGGQMADGLVATKDGVAIDTSEPGKDGDFDYRNYTVAEKGVDITTKEYDDADPAHQILENHTYNKEMADALYDALGIKASDYESVNLTFVKNGDSWDLKAVTAPKYNDDAVAATPGTTNTSYVEAAAGDDYTTTTVGANTLIQTIKTGVTLYKDNDGTDTPWAEGDTIGAIDKLYIKKTTTEGGTEATPATLAGEKDITSKVNLKGVTATQVGDGSKTNEDDASGDGGITISFGEGKTLNAIFNAEDAKDGDFITFSFSNVDANNYAPTNIGVAEDTMKIDNTGVADGTPLTNDKVTVDVKLGDEITDENMDAEMQAALDELKDITVKFDGTDITLDRNDKVTLNADGKTLEYENAKGAKVALATVEVTVDTDGLEAGDTYSLEFGLKSSAYNFAEGADVEAHAVATSEATKSTLEGPAPASESNYYKQSTARLSYANHITLQVGSRSKDAVDFSFDYSKYDTDMGDLTANLNISARKDGLNTESLSLADQKSANYAIDQIDKAINKVSMVRATFGSIQNRLEYKIDNLTTTSANLTEAESAIRDTDMASEMMNYTKYGILQQAAQSMLAQANTQPQSILQLLG